MSRLASPLRRHSSDGSAGWLQPPVAAHKLRWEKQSKGTTDECGRGNSRSTILGRIRGPPGGHPAREAAAHLNLTVWEARLDAAGGAQLERTGTAATGKTHPDGPHGDDVALFLHTSGTTSRPKGVPLTHANLVASIRNIVATYALTPVDASLIVM